MLANSNKVNAHTRVHHAYMHLYVYIYHGQKKKNGGKSTMQPYLFFFFFPFSQANFLISLKITKLIGWMERTAFTLMRQLTAGGGGAGRKEINEELFGAGT